jgi:hypothetical protein
MYKHRIAYELLAFGGYSNILENDRMFSPRDEMLKAGLTTDYADTH